MDPDIVLFDEVTSALDPQLTYEVLKVIRDLVFKEGLTSIMISHDMKFAREIADRVIFMEEGLIRLQGTPEEVLDGQPSERLRRFLNPSLPVTVTGQGADGPRSS
jgi:ABC-type polar amino acid transport system ATPase subunit